jgi:hypothetical protein
MIILLLGSCENSVRDKKVVLELLKGQKGSFNLLHISFEQLIESVNGPQHNNVTQTGKIYFSISFRIRLPTYFNSFVHFPNRLLIAEDLLIVLQSSLMKDRKAFQRHLDNTVYGIVVSLDYLFYHLNIMYCTTGIG